VTPEVSLPSRLGLEANRWPWRAAAVTRYVGAGELGSGVYFNPVAPEAAARALRNA
jgi:galactose-1-phosphate uridylyltransferase